MKTRRIISIITAICMAAVGMMTAPLPSHAATDEQSGADLSATRGVYYFSPHIHLTDLTDTYIYSDALLMGDSKEYNQSLATMSFELAVASISSMREPTTEEGYLKKCRNLLAYLEDNGFSDIETNPDYKKRPEIDTMGVACAHKRIRDKGKDYTLLVIVPRSAGYELEWSNNFAIGESGDHIGFTAGKNKVLTFAKQYVADHGITGPVKVWTAGYSRGAAVTNLVGAAILDDPVGSLGIQVDPSDFYCYTYGTPKPTVSTQAHAERYQYIHNSYEKYDAVTILGPTGFGFDRYGTWNHYAVFEDESAAEYQARKARFLELVQETNPDVYQAYTEGGDPDFFYPKKLDISYQEGLKLNIVDDDESIYPYDQNEMMTILEDSILAACGSRENYAAEYQPALTDFFGFLNSDTDRAAVVIEGFKGSRYAVPFVAAAYMSYMADRYKKNRIRPEMEELKSWTEELKQIIEAMREDPQADPQVIDQLEEYLDTLAGLLDTGSTLGDLADLTREIAGYTLSLAVSDGLKAAGVDESDEWFKRMTRVSECMPISHVLAYMLLYSPNQTEDFTFNYLDEQFKRLATFMGNTGAFTHPHKNEVILSWLKTLDVRYDDLVKENDIQKTGYRRVYIGQAEGSEISGLVRDSKGRTVAEFTDGRLTSRQDAWIGITSCDEGCWLRLPLGEDYEVDFRAGADTSLDLKVTEYSVSEGAQVREETSDQNMSWTGLALTAGQPVTLVVSKVQGKGDRALPSAASYYIKTKARPVIMARATAKGKKKLALKWSKVSGADRYVIYMSKCSGPAGKNKLKKVKSVGAGTLKWTRKGLKKKTMYKFKVVAQKKVEGKYRDLAVSKTGHVITGNQKGRYTNPKKLKLNTASVTLRKGGSYAVKGKVTKKKAKKKLMTGHTALLRYVTDDPAVATVSSKGKITAKGPGSCRIYVLTINGMWRTVMVNVP